MHIPDKDETISIKPKEADEILDEQISISLKEHKRSKLGLFISSFAAGLEVGFSVLLMGILYTLLHAHYPFALMITKVGAAMHIAEPEAFVYLAHKMADQEGIVILGSAVLAGWLMGLLGWMVTSSQETIGRIVVITLITTIIGIGGLHHCIVGSIEVFSGLLVSSEISMGHYFHFQVWATLGNAIGGVVFVALVKYSHIKADKT